MLPKVCFRCRRPLLFIERLNGHGLCKICRKHFVKRFLIPVVQLEEIQGPPSDPNGIWRDNVRQEGSVQQFYIQTKEDLTWLRHHFEKPRPQVFYKIANRIKGVSPFYFRGQWREYFRDGLVWIAPSWLRRSHLYTNIEGIVANYESAIIKWSVLLQSCFPSRYLIVKYKYQHKTIIHKGIPVIEKHPQILAIMQQYGFPTHLLDVTSSLDAALWFSFHSFKGIEERKQAGYINVKFPDDREYWPTIYIFSPFSVIDFRRLGAGQGTVMRPVVQRAAFIPGTPIEARYHNYPRIFFSVVLSSNSGVEGLITCIIKVSPRLIKSTIKLKTEDLFPPPNKDPLYKLLCANRPQGFIRYI